MSAWAQTIGQSVGRTGNEFGTAVDANIQTALHVIQQKLIAQEMQQRLKESQIRIDALQQPTYQYFPQGAHGTSVLPVNPLTNAPAGPPQTIIPDSGNPPKSTDQLLAEATQAGDWATVSKIINEKTQLWQIEHPEKPEKASAAEEQLRIAKQLAKEAGLVEGTPAYNKRVEEIYKPAAAKIIMGGGVNAGGGGGGDDISGMAKDWAEKGIKPSGGVKVERQVRAYMIRNGMTPSAKPKLTAADERLATLVKQIDPKIANLKKLIEDNNLQDDNSFVFSSHSALANWVKFHGEYQRGVSPDKLSSDLIKGAAALQVMGAAPWMTMGRGKYMFETVVQHLPSPIDTPGQLYNKLEFLQGIMDDAKGALPAGTFPDIDLSDLGGSKVK